MTDIQPVNGVSTLFDVRYHLEMAARHCVTNGLHNIGKLIMLVVDLVKKKQDEATEEIKMLLREMAR